MSESEVIIELGAEGGSITLFGVRSPRGWLYSRSVDDWTPELIDEERIEHDSNVVELLGSRARAPRSIPLAPALTATRPSGISTTNLGRGAEAV